jgi:hypothetical protein
VTGQARPARVWRGSPGYWMWDVRHNGMRSTGGRTTWREAYDVALDELAWMLSVSGRPG